MRSLVKAYFLKDGWPSIQWKAFGKDSVTFENGPVRGLYAQGRDRDYGRSEPMEARPLREYIQLASREIVSAKGKNWTLRIADYSYSERLVNGKYKQALVGLYYAWNNQGGYVMLSSSAAGEKRETTYSSSLRTDEIRTLEGLFEKLKGKFQSK